MDRTVFYDHKYTAQQNCKDKTEIEVRNSKPHIPKTGPSATRKSPLCHINAHKVDPRGRSKACYPGIT